MSVCACLRCILALIWARAISPSVGMRWGSFMSSTGNRGLPRGLLDGSEGVRDHRWVVLECWALGKWSMRANLGEGLEELSGLRGSLSLSLDGRGLGFLVRCWVGCVGNGSGGVVCFWVAVIGAGVVGV